MLPILEIENLSKQYRLGDIGTGNLTHDINRWWHIIRGKEDPYRKVGETNDRTKIGKTDYVWALQDINLQIQQGEVLGIIGANGAGKSTLLKVLSRVTAPTTGKIITRGRIASLLEVGTGFHSDLTGRENIYLNGAILGMTKKEITSKMDEIIEFSGCDRYIDTPVKRYSSGMYVRLAFAVAAHLEPEILIVDEVLAVGDAEFQKKAIGKMQDISKGQGRTVLFVSHNMAAISQLCNKSILLSKGTIIKYGNTDSIIEYYLKENSKNEISINNPKSRIGSKDVYISDVSVLDNLLVKTENFNSGDSIIVDVTFKSKPEINISNIVFGIGIDNQLGVRIFSGSSSWLGKVFSKTTKDESFNVKFYIKDLPLHRGTYLISIIASNGIEPLDYIEHCASFTIFDNDRSYALGRTSEHGEIKLNYEIKLVNE